MNRIIELRQENRIKQVDLAKALKVSQGTLSNWERGVHDVDQKSLNFLADFFGVSIDYLLGRSEIRRTNEVAAASSDTPYDDLPPEALKELEQYKEFLKQKYSKKKE